MIIFLLLILIILIAALQFCIISIIVDTGDNKTSNAVGDTIAAVVIAILIFLLAVYVNNHFIFIEN